MQGRRCKTQRATYDKESEICREYFRKKYETYLKNSYSLNKKKTLTYPSCQLYYGLYRRNNKIRTGFILSFEIISWDLFPLLMKGASNSEAIYDVHQ